MRVCGLCRKNDALESGEVRLNDTALLIQPNAYQVLKITEGVSKNGKPAELFEPVDACAECIGKIFTSGKPMPVSTETVE